MRVKQVARRSKPTKSFAPPLSTRPKLTDPTSPSLTSSSKPLSPHDNQSRITTFSKTSTSSSKPGKAAGFKGTKEGKEEAGDVTDNEEDDEDRASQRALNDSWPAIEPDNLASPGRAGSGATLERDGRKVVQGLEGDAHKDDEEGVDDLLAHAFPQAQDPLDQPFTTSSDSTPNLDINTPAIPALSQLKKRKRVEADVDRRSPEVDDHRDEVIDVEVDDGETRAVPRANKRVKSTTRPASRRKILKENKVKLSDLSNQYKWPKKGKNTFKGRMQALGCDVCQGWVHWACAGLQSHEEYAEDKWKCPPCSALKAEHQATIITDDETCIRPDCILRAHQSPPKEEEDYELWLMKGIIGRKDIKAKKGRRAYKYLVEWIDWEVCDATWEPPYHIPHLASHVQTFMSEAEGQGKNPKTKGVVLLKQAEKCWDANGKLRGKRSKHWLEAWGDMGTE